MECFMSKTYMELIKELNESSKILFLEFCKSLKIDKLLNYLNDLLKK